VGVNQSILSNTRMVQFDLLLRMRRRIDNELRKKGRLQFVEGFYEMPGNVRC